eukprot:6899452-Prymnesium_polylepis.1
MYNNGVIDYSAKIVKIVPDSSCEAESAVASLASKGTCYVRVLCRFHKRRIHNSTPMLLARRQQGPVRARAAGGCVRSYQ